MTEAKHDRLSRTPLYDTHVALGARLVPFGGFEMPVQYTGIIDEHERCRRGAAIFDTCHMGEFQCAGPAAVQDLERLVSCRVKTLKEGRCRYGMMLNPAGGVLDDLIIYRLGIDSFMIVVNAATRATDAAWIREHLSANTRFQDLSEDLGKLDVQGPESARVVSDILDKSVVELPYFAFARLSYRGGDLIVSRTGYTGELGYEVYAPVGCLGALWHAFMDAGASPAGLGARDTLRLEAGLPLYGHELSAEVNAAAGGMARSLSKEKAFIGREAVDASDGLKRLVALRLAGRRAARAGDDVILAGGCCGTVTSGSFAPSLGCAIALAYVSGTLEAGMEVTVGPARKQMSATVTALPFYRGGTARLSVKEVCESLNR